MNKLEGLYELKRLNIPAIDWQIYEHDTKLDDEHLWTIRTAVYQGNDLSLPRLFGQNAVTSQKFAEQALMQLENRGIVIYYPYLIAEKSGNLQIGDCRIVIEAVEGDLSNLLTDGKVDVTYVWENAEQRVTGNCNFLSINEREQIKSYVEYLRRRYMDVFREGKELQLEFSFAFESSETGKRKGERKLVFFEIRTV